MAQIVEEPIETLDACIYAYLTERGLTHSAQQFEQEARVKGPAFKLQRGYLQEWWTVFWSVFAARARQGQGAKVPASKGAQVAGYHESPLIRHASAPYPLASGSEPAKHRQDKRVREPAWVAKPVHKDSTHEVLGAPEYRPNSSDSHVSTNLLPCNNTELRRTNTPPSGRSSSATDPGYKWDQGTPQRNLHSGSISSRDREAVELQRYIMGMESGAEKDQAIAHYFRLTGVAPQGVPPSSTYGPTEQSELFARIDQPRQRNQGMNWHSSHHGATTARFQHAHQGGPYLQTGYWKKPCQPGYTSLEHRPYCTPLGYRANSMPASNEFPPVLGPHSSFAEGRTHSKPARMSSANANQDVGRPGTDTQRRSTMIANPKNDADNSQQQASSATPRANDLSINKRRNTPVQGSASARVNIEGGKGLPRPGGSSLPPLKCGKHSDLCESGMSGNAGAMKQGTLNPLRGPSDLSDAWLEENVPLPGSPTGSVPGFSELLGEGLDNMTFSNTPYQAPDGGLMDSIDSLPGNRDGKEGATQASPANSGEKRSRNAAAGLSISKRAKAS